MPGERKKIHPMVKAQLKSSAAARRYNVAARERRNAAVEFRRQRGNKLSYQKQAAELRRVTVSLVRLTPGKIMEINNRQKKTGMFSFTHWHISNNF